MIQNGLQALLLKIAEKSSKGGKEKGNSKNGKGSGKGKGNSKNGKGKGKRNFNNWKGKEKGNSKNVLVKLYRTKYSTLAALNWQFVGD